MVENKLACVHVSMKVYDFVSKENTKYSKCKSYSTEKRNKVYKLNKALN